MRAADRYAAAYRQLSQEIHDAQLVRPRYWFTWGVLLSCSSSCWSKLCWARFVERPVSEHGEQHVSSSTGEGDDGLVVAFAFGAFLVVVGPRGGVAFNRSKSRQKQDAFEDFVAASGGCFAADRGPRLAGHGCDASI